jgi:hypothetical protein
MTSPQPVADVLASASDRAISSGHATSFRADASAPGDEEQLGDGAVDLVVSLL